ncbi:hypothetical protein [uncultured Lacinutrix sp.]|uniref:hypothetical protein n=1 Tax=uncultured Lacinutrix sp. TaxID=574032 RepID=UPI0026390662|nr:hypothetical protein [uncultured Lacinutrix sp.]
MNFLKSTKIILLFAVTIVMSCSKDDDAPTVSTPDVNYSFTTFFSTFFQEGNTGVPTVNWNGNQGTFSLATSLDGLSINSANGVVSWTNQLPTGEHSIIVLASNSAGQKANSFIIENKIQGAFTGTYDLGYFKVEFNTDGTALVTADDATSAPQFSGTWYIINNEVIVNFTFNTDATVQYSLKGNLVQSNAATYSGTIYSLHDAIAGNELYAFNVELN